VTLVVIEITSILIKLLGLDISYLDIVVVIEHIE
jgi:hypothetical protein